MHNNYYFIRQLAYELDGFLVGFKLVDAYSQNKDEAIFSFFKEKQEFHLIAHLTGQFTCLAFPSEFIKAKKNTAVVFQQLIGKKVTSITSFANERAMAIGFEENRQLVFKLFGRQANLLLFNQGAVTELFKKSYKADYNLTLEGLHRNIEQSPQALLDALPNYRDIYPTLHKKMVSQIDLAIKDKVSTEASRIILKLIKGYSQPAGYWVNQELQPSLEISVDKKEEQLINSPIEAITKFFFLYLRFTRQNQLKNRLLSELQRKISKTEVYLAKVRRKVRSIAHETNYKLYADLLMANLHQIPKNIDSVALADFNDEAKKITVKVNSQLTAQQNAERYYKKAKNINLEIDNLNTSIRTKELLLKELNEKRTAIEQAGDIKTLRKFSKSTVIKQPAKEVPFKTFIVDGYTIYVGNNAKQNDQLTLKFANKNDLFFHAKDVAGSHVILKPKAGTNVPARVLEATASIAAYYSKRKTESLCPVAYTEKKYVRKPKGSPPGLVTVEREKVILVPPELPRFN